MQEVVIVGAARTPLGLYMESLANQRVQDLAASSMKGAMGRSGIDSSQLDLCIYSEAKQSSFPANIGRHAWLLAGFDENPGGFTLNTLCAGALQSLFSGFNKIRAGEYQGIMTGGAETNSLAPYYLQHPRYKFGPDNLCFHDMKVEVETHAQPIELYGELTGAVIADGIAANYGFTREELDEYVIASKEKAVIAAKNGALKNSIVPIIRKVKKGEVTVETDDGAQKSTTLETLMAMTAINDGTSSGGNLAPLADGAASTILMSGAKAKDLGCKPIAKVLGFGIAAGNPKLIERTTLKSIEKALKWVGIQLETIDFFDLHEPSAAYALAVSNKLGSSVSQKINVDGGSLAYGHAGATTGGAMVVNMIYRLQRTGAKLGLVNVGALGGQSISVVLERV